jgi:ketosteroid isomerase-like protein
MSTTTGNENFIRGTVSRDQDEIRSLIAGLHRAHFLKDAAAIAAPYASDATIFNLAPPLEHRGVNLAEKKTWLDSWETPVEIVPKDFAFTVSGEFAFAHGLLHMSGTKKGSEGAVRFWMRETMCFERMRGQWRIVHEHTSVPFYMDESLRPAFDLQP